LRELVEPVETRSTSSSEGGCVVRASSIVERWAKHFVMSRAEFMSATGLLAFMIVFKIVNILRYRFDSDESQHMHVIWHDFLIRGEHLFTPTTPVTTLAFLWVRDVNLHYSPFDHVPPKPGKRWSGPQ
jgi:hypothetical protein